MNRFVSECPLCADLLTEYISAANDMVDTKQRFSGGRESCSRQLASALIDNALKRRNEARNRLFQHKDQQH